MIRWFVLNIYYPLYYARIRWHVSRQEGCCWCQNADCGWCYYAGEIGNNFWCKNFIQQHHVGYTGRPYE